LLKKVEEYIDRTEGMTIDDSIRAIEEDCGGQS
jgi:hypothetical protein